MPTGQPTPCAWKKCGRATHTRFCTEHTRALMRIRDEQRGSRHERGYTSKWSKASKAFIAKHPTCKYCGKPSECVDHDPPHKGDMKMFWDRSTWHPSCNHCNRAKAAKQEGRWGSR